MSCGNRGFVKADKATVFKGIVGLERWSGGSAASFMDDVANLRFLIFGDGSDSVRFDDCESLGSKLSSS